VVVLWPYEWKVTGLNLDRKELTFIFAKFSLEWTWKGRENPSRMGKPRGSKKVLSLFVRVLHVFLHFILNWTLCGMIVVLCALWLRIDGWDVVYKVLLGVLYELNEGFRTVDVVYGQTLFFGD